MRLLDILIGTLIVFPVLSDAIWLDLPSFYALELSDLGVPLLAAAVVLLIVHRLWAAPWRLGRIAEGTLRSVQSFPTGLVSIGWMHLTLVVGVTIAAAVFAYWLVSNRILGEDLPSKLAWALTHGTGAVAVIALAAAAARRWFSEPWERSFFFRLGVRVSCTWLAIVNHSPARALWGAAVAWGAFLFWVALLRHRAFESHGFDLGIFTNTIWNLAHGKGYISSVKGGINLFLDHQSPLFWIFAPLFWVVPAPESLLGVQALGLAAGGPALYYLGRTHFSPGHWAPAALPWLYWLWLPMRNATAFDFHPEVFMLPLILWAFVAFGSGRLWVRVLGLVPLLAALGAKESAGVVAAGIGVAWAWIGSIGAWRARWPGIVLAIGGVALFLFDVKVVPAIFGGDYAYLGLYGRFGGGIGDVMLAPFTRPAYFFSQVLNLERLHFLLWTLAPLGFLPLFAGRAAVAALPPYVMLFLSEGDQRVNIFFHYGIEPGTALFWALPLGLAIFARRFGWRTAGIWMLFFAAAFIGPSDLSRARGYRATPHAQWLADEALPCIDGKASTAASDVLIPHLATRSWISYPDLLEQKPSGNPVLCVVADLSTRNWPLGVRGVENVLSELPRRGYNEAYRCGPFRVHQLGTFPCLRCTPRCDESPSR